jgi:hypothetical protein
MGRIVQPRWSGTLTADATVAKCCSGSHCPAPAAAAACRRLHAALCPAFQLATWHSRMQYLQQQQQQPGELLFLKSIAAISAAQVVVSHTIGCY